MPNWFELPNEQLLETLKEVWYLKAPKLIGKLVRRGNYYFFADIRSNEFRKVEYPENPYNKEIEILFSPEDDSALNLNSYYEFYIGVRDIEKRVVRNRLLILYAAKKNYIELTPRPFIERRSKVYTGINIELADTIRKAIKTLTSDINREPETFIYELLQNADDYKDIAKKTVAVKFTLTPNYLLLTHDGQPFNFQNVYALTGISQGDKRDNIETIGFKGIGFKSIFKDSNFAIVKSGGFEFKFDESYFPKEAKRPWQIIPIWVERYDEELLLNEDFNSAPVLIAIKPTSGNEKLREVEKSYKNILNRVFKDDRILIFLRWIDKISITDTTDSNYLIELNKNKEKWFISTGLTDIEVEESIRNWLNKQISDEDITVPEKYENIQKTKITFAVERAGSKLVGTTNSKVYNYLPTEIDFGFKFLINGDFIPDGSRTELHNNEWNNYLGKIVGKKFVEWLSILGNHKWSYIGKSRNFDRDYLTLVPNFSEPKALSAGKNTFFLEKFKEGFKEAIAGSEPISFVPTMGGELEILSNTFIDETGLSTIIPLDFASLTDINLKPIHNEIGEGLERIKALINDYKVGKIFSSNDLKLCLQQEKFQTWLKIPANNFKVLKYFFHTSNTELKSFLETEKIILMESGELSKAEEIYTSIPDEVAFIANNKLNTKLKSLLDREKLEIKTKKFNATEFLNSNKAKINSLLTSETNIINFWNFIYDNWREFKDDDDIKKSLSKLNILCKPIEPGKLNIQTLETVYLPKELAKEDEVESIIESLQLTGKHFIENKFETIKRPNEKQKWNEIFCSAKRGLSAVIKELIPNLKTLEDLLHFKACNEIFKYWKNSKDKPDKQLTKDELTLISQTLKLKCGDTYKLASQCIISEYFAGTNLMNKIMPSIILKNQINNEYQPIQSLVADWNQFFGLINCIKLNGEQEVFNAKIDYLLSKQVDFQANHFEIIKEFDSLLQANKTKEIKINFDFEKKFSKLLLVTSTEGIWATANELHFPTEYAPALELQSDNEVQSQFKYLSPSYLANAISKEFLMNLGVHNNFTFLNLTATSYAFYPLILITKKNYIPKFWKFILESDSRVKLFASSNLPNHIKTGNSIEVAPGIFKKPSELYANILSKYIEDKNSIPLLDFSKYYVDERKTVTLEEHIGINQDLNISQCLSLLKKSDTLTQNEVNSIGIVNIIHRNNVTPENISGIKLPNSTYKWIPNSEIYYSTEAEIISQHPNNLLHQDFTTVFSKVGVVRISSSDYKTIYSPTPNSIADTDIKTKFNSRAEFVAYVIANGETRYSAIAENIKADINKLNYIECDDLYDTIKHSSLIWKRPRKSLETKSIIYFTDELSSKKSDIRKYLYKIVSQYGKVAEIIFHRYIFDESELEIIQELNRTQDKGIPEKWLNKIQENENQFRKEVEQFIEGLLEVEDIYDEDKVQELKSILADFKNQPDEKRKTFNLLAKLKLCKRIGLSYDNKWEYNKVLGNNEKYFIHSARGSFAYIHPNELIQMRDEGFKMAIDFGTNDIRIYNSASEIIELYKNYLMLYQGNPSEDDILNLCVDTQDKAKFHFLIVDREKQTNDALAILKILNNESYE